MINQKVTFPRDDNFSDDELAFLPYFIYFFTLEVCSVHAVVLCMHVHYSVTMCMYDTETVY